MADLRSFAHLDYEVVDHIATIRFNRPERHNSFDKQMSLDIVKAMDLADHDDAVRVVVFTAAGKNFCAGAALAESMASLTDPNEEYDRAAGSIADAERDSGGYAALAIARSLKPVIGAIGGAAVGVGATITLPMDIRIVGRSTRFGFVFNRRGLVPESLSSWYLPRLVPMGRAMEWVLTGRLIAAEEAREAGLANRVVDDEELETVAFDLAREIVEQVSPVSASLARQLMWHGLEAASPWSVHRDESRALAARFASADCAEGLASFFDKRAPQFCQTVPSDLPDVVKRPARRPDDV